MNNSKFYSNIFLLILVIFLYKNSFAQKDSIVNLTLQDALILTEENNQAIKNSKIDIIIAKKKIWETTAIGLPQVNGKISYQNIFKVPEVSFGKAFYIPDNVPAETPINNVGDLRNFYIETPPLALGVKQNITFDLTVSQLVFSGEYIVGLQATKAFKQLMELSESKTINDAKESVKQAYYLVLVAEENFKILKSGLELIDKTYSELIQINKAGYIEETDVDQFKINKTNLENMIASVERQVNLAYDLLKFQIGLENTKGIKLLDNLESIISQENAEQYINSEFKIDNNPDYQLMLNQVTLTKLSLKREKSKFLPSIAAFYRYERLQKAPSFNFSIPHIFGVGMEIPIFGSGMKLSRVGQAKLELEKSNNTLEKVEQGLTLQYLKTKNEYITSYNQYLSIKENVSLTKKIYERTLIKYKEGLSSSQELTLVQNQHLTTQASYFNTILDVLNKKATLEKLVSNNK
ncbi:MAG: hypothetical protein A2046_09815 [Bacteroidetes bacterium GWA2_30_7]|nr:MAG: hypothetical protein A2046_09815 [Bacteroidetes bacterium GWA2_30_7]